MALAKQLTFKNTSTETVFVDTVNIQNSKSSVKRDLNNIKSDLENIYSAYNKLSNHKDTKGSWKETLISCTKKCKQYKTNVNSAKTKLEDRIDAAVIDYVLIMINELKNTQKAADSINTDAGF